MIEARGEKVLASGVIKKAAVGFQLIHPVGVERGLARGEAGELAGGQGVLQKTGAGSGAQRSYRAVGIVDAGHGRGSLGGEAAENGVLAGGGQKDIRVGQEWNSIFRILAQ